MRRRLCNLACVLLAIPYLFGPFFETVDRWDSFPQSGNDIVLTVTAIAICFGLVFALVRACGRLLNRSSVAISTLQKLSFSPKGPAILLPLFLTCYASPPLRV
jgi:hypothetical protein